MIDDNSGWVYLIHIEGTTYYKIGFAKSIKNRLNQMQTGCPHKMKVVAKVNHSNARSYESLIHSFVRDRNVRGEWFDLDDDYLAEVKTWFKPATGTGKFDKTKKKTLAEMLAMEVPPIRPVVKNWPKVTKHKA
jgi:hypothetical protein